MLEAAIAPVSEALQRLDDPARAEQWTSAEVIRLYTRMLADNPWVPALIVQEVLAEGGRFREQFIENFAGRLAPLFAAIIRASRRGAIRGDLDPNLAALSAISMTVFPVRRAAGDEPGARADRDGRRRGAPGCTHTIRVLFEGIRAVEDCAMNRHAGSRAACSHCWSGPARTTMPGRSRCTARSSETGSSSSPSPRADRRRAGARG
jgi:hypothetical protein